MEFVVDLGSGLALRKADRPLPVTNNQYVPFKNVALKCSRVLCV